MGANIKIDQDLFDFYFFSKINPDSTLEKINKLVDWKPIEKYLAKKLKRKPAAAGQPPYPALIMFKIVLLQAFNNMSDESTAFAIRDRLSFLHFIGLPFESAKPDASTICRFRRSLLEKKHYSKLLDLFNTQLLKHGLLVKSCTAVDATLIASERRPRKVMDIEKIPVDREESLVKSEESEVTVSYSDDKDAAWTIKGGKATYGFKAHVATDAENGFVLGGKITSANVADTKELEAVVSKIGLKKGAKVLADKGYTSKANSEMLKERGLEDGIMHKGNRGRVLTEEEKIINKKISSKRCSIERFFGTLKTKYGMFRARYIGINKVELEFTIKALVFNLKKAVNLAF